METSIFYFTNFRFRFLRCPASTVTCKFPVFILKFSLERFDEKMGSIFLSVSLISFSGFSFRIEDHLKKLYLIQQELLNEGLVIQAQEAHDIAMNYSGDNMRFDDDDEKSRKKTVKSKMDQMAIIAR